MKTKLAIIASIFTLIGLLIALVVTIYLVRKPQETRSRAAVGASLSWSATPANPVIGDTVKVTINANSPDTSIDAAQIQITFDSFDYLDIARVENRLDVALAVQFPTTLQEPTLVDKELRFAYGASSNLAEVKGTNITIATISLIVKAAGTTQLNFVQIPNAGTRLSGSGNNSNLLASGGFPRPLTITTTDGSGTLPTGQASVTPEGSTTPTAGIGSSGTASASATPTTEAQSIPTCTTLTISPSSGTAPLTVTFTGNGTVTGPASIAASEFSFGEGQTQVVEKAYGKEAAETVTHTYQNPGTFQVYVRFRNSSGSWSSIPSSCSGQVTISPQQSGTSTSHYTCQGGSCIAVAGSGADECNPNQTNVCQLPKEISKLPTSGSVSPTIIAVIGGIFLITLGSLVFR